MGSRPYQSQSVQAVALANSLYVLDRLETLSKDEVEEAADCYIIEAGISSRRDLFHDIVWRKLQGLRASGRTNSWSERRQHKEAKR